MLDEGGLSAPAEVLEIGAGTGKLTAALLARGLRVTAIEPSAAMAAVARAKLPDVQLVQGEFEAYRPSRRFDAVACAAAWHWLDPGRRWRLAHAALAPGGTLALFWNFVDWRRCPLRDELSAIYRREAPELAPRFSMHPDTAQARLTGELMGDAHEDGGYENAHTVDVPWTRTLDATAYTDLLGTHQDHILLSPDTRARLFAALSRLVRRHGGRLQLPTVCRVGLATAR